MKNQKGFTLIELLVVITIIGILAVGAFAVFNGAQAKARDGSRLNDMQALSSATTLYHADTTAVPNNVTAALTTAVLATALEGGYINSLPADPSPLDAGAVPRYRYSYWQGPDNGISYQLFEFNTNLEATTNNGKETGDGGNHDDIYETGSGMTTLAPDGTGAEELDYDGDLADTQFHVNMG